MCIQIPECPPATVAEQHEGTLSASGFDVKFILFQLLGTLVNYLTRILEYRFPCYPIDGGNLWQTKFYSMQPMASLHSSILAWGSTFWRICRSGNFVNFIKITATDCAIAGYGAAAAGSGRSGAGKIFPAHYKECRLGLWAPGGGLGTYSPLL